ncbi:hypothetical protein FACS1894211_05390 [Clostridia bacterium]|nr:hypothetical protein FACS1894211_05390 [Clostridia bacterium]
MLFIAIASLIVAAACGPKDPAPNGPDGQPNQPPAAQTVTVTFVTNRTGVSVSAQTGKTGDALTLPAPTAADATFDGWYNQALTEKFTAAVYPAADTTLYGKWTEIPDGTQNNPIPLAAGATERVPNDTLDGTWFAFTPATTGRYAVYASVGPDVDEVDPLAMLYIPEGDTAIGEPGDDIDDGYGVDVLIGEDENGLYERWDDAKYLEIPTRYFLIDREFVGGLTYLIRAMDWNDWAYHDGENLDEEEIEDYLRYHDESRPYSIHAVKIDVGDDPTLTTDYLSLLFGNPVFADGTSYEVGADDAFHFGRLSVVLSMLLDAAGDYYAVPLAVVFPTDGGYEWTVSGAAANPVAFYDMSEESVIFNDGGYIFEADPSGRLFIAVFDGAPGDFTLTLDALTDAEFWTWKLERAPLYTVGGAPISPVLEDTDDGVYTAYFRVGVEQAGRYRVNVSDAAEFQGDFFTGIDQNGNPEHAASFRFYDEDDQSLIVTLDAGTYYAVLYVIGSDEGVTFSLEPFVYTDWSQIDLPEDIDELAQLVEDSGELDYWEIVDTTGFDEYSETTRAVLADCKAESIFWADYGYNSNGEDYRALIAVYCASPEDAAAFPPNDKAFAASLIEVFTEFMLTVDETDFDESYSSNCVGNIIVIQFTLRGVVW